MSASPNSMKSSIMYELKLVGLQGTVTACALALLSVVNSNWFAILKWPLTIFAIFKICSVYESARIRQYQPIARILANVILCIVVTSVSLGIDATLSDLKEEDKYRHSTLFKAITKFHSNFNMLIIARGLYHFVDNAIAPGYLSGFTNSYSSTQSTTDTNANANSNLSNGHLHTD